MKRVTGIGGIFFKCKDPKKMNEWYARHLGIPVTQYGATFNWRDSENPEKDGSTVWSTFSESSDYFWPSEGSFMINYRVENMADLLETLKDEGIEIVGGPEEYEYGIFAWIVDPEGNKIELWQPTDESKL